jgi:hypothetical protein
MNYIDELYSHKKWYLAHEILFIEVDDASSQESFPVWENLILIKANNPEEAFEKAMINGRNSEEPVTIQGVNGYLRFKGLKDLILINDDLEDGAELEWIEYEVDKDKLNQLVRAKQDMHAFTLRKKFEESQAESEY